MVEAPKHTAGRLTVELTGPEGQCTIRSDFRRRKGEWRDIYVEFSGYFGSYGPHMFAEAPAMLDALKAVRFILSDSDARKAIDAVLAKAEGRHHV